MKLPCRAGGQHNDLDLIRQIDTSPDIVPGTDRPHEESRWSWDERVQELAEHNPDLVRLDDMDAYKSLANGAKHYEVIGC